MYACRIRRESIKSSSEEQSAEHGRSGGPIRCRLRIRRYLSINVTGAVNVETPSRRDSRGRFHRSEEYSRFFLCLPVNPTPTCRWFAVLAVAASYPRTEGPSQGGPPVDLAEWFTNHTQSGPVLGICRNKISPIRRMDVRIARSQPVFK